MRIKCRGFEGMLVSCEGSVTKYTNSVMIVYNLRIRIDESTFVDMYHVRQSEIEVIPCESSAEVK